MISKASLHTFATFHSFWQSIQNLRHALNCLNRNLKSNYLLQLLPDFVQRFSWKTIVDKFLNLKTSVFEISYSKATVLTILHILNIFKVLSNTCNFLLPRLSKANSTFSSFFREKYWSCSSDKTSQIQWCS